LFEDFEIENSEKVLDGGGHGWFRLTGVEGAIMLQLGG
jgi:hypothetical protein